MIPHPLILKITKSIIQNINKGHLLRFLWVPYHMGIEGNEQADKLAKALNLEIGNHNERYDSYYQKGF